MRKTILSVGLACGFLFLLMLGLRAYAEQEVPLGRHCIGAGPLLPDPDFCGCTWGEVLFHGRPVPGATVTLTFQSGAVMTTTRPTAEWAPYFGLTAHYLDPGARRGDVLTLTALFGGQTVSRTFRAWPDAEGEQYVPLVFPERGVWSPWVTGGYTRALALAGDVVWAGGPAGLISVSLSTGISVPHALPWSDPTVRALAVGTDGHVWAAGAGGVAEFDGSAWHSHAVPLGHTLRALAVDRATGMVWLGGGDDGSEGSVATYTGAWQITGTFGAPVTALAVDAEGYAWAGTWGEGVYQQDGDGWTRYRVVDGLASDNVLAAMGVDEAVWFGTSPYLSGQGDHGGIARYDLTAGIWQVYTTAHSLPADDIFSSSPAAVYALARGEDGTVWAGTAKGVSFLVGESWWAAYTTTHGLRPGAVTALVVGSGTTIAATPAGLDRLDPSATPGGPPVAQIDAVSPLTLTLGTTLALSGNGWDGDEDGKRVVTWDWSSSLDGELCTSRDCTLSHSLFTPGDHSIVLRVQDDEGDWSAPVMETVAVEEAQRVYLPLVVK